MNEIKYHLVMAIMWLEKNKLVRKALNTFWQTFLAVWVSTGLRMDKVTLIACIACALSATKTFLVEYIKDIRS